MFGDSSKDPPSTLTHRSIKKPLHIENKTISWCELEKHNTEESCWVAIRGKVYDVTSWLHDHPGGKASILNVSGRDVTDMMNQYHVISAWQGRVKKMYVGELQQDANFTKAGNTDFAVDCRLLQEKFEKDGWYKPCSSYFYQKYMQVALLFVASWCCVLLGHQRGNTPLQLLGGALVGIFWQQCNFIGHDAGHGYVVYNNRAKNSFVGIFVGNIFTGLSIAWWKHSHYTHHVVTNVITDDPDIQHLPVLAVDTKFFTSESNCLPGATSLTPKCNSAGFWNWCKFIVSYQQYLYFPVMSVARLNLHIQSIVHVFTFPKVEQRLREVLGLAVFWSWWLCMISFLPSWRSRIMFWYLSHLFVSLIHIQICLSHFSMDMFETVPMKKEDESVFEFQLRTTLDVDCPPWLDWLHGGLQFQALHHMFPRVPRHRLREVQPLVQALCDKHGVSYQRHGFFEANCLTFEHMARVADAARRGSIVADLHDTLIFHGFHAIG